MNQIRKNFTRNFYVYIYENECGDPIYVGRGCGNRIKTHLSIALRRTKPHPFYFKLRKMLKNGIKPKFYKVYKKLSIDEAITKEIELIKKLGRKDLGTGSLLNLSDGGEGLISMSEQHRDIIRLRHTGKVNSAITKQKISSSKKGQQFIFFLESNSKPTWSNITLSSTVVSKSHRNKISKALKGRKCSQESITKRKDLRWVNDTKQSIRIHKNDLQKYLENGWIQGRHKYYTNETVQKMSLSAKNRKSMSNETKNLIGKISADRRWINDGDKNKFIHFSKIEEFLKQGWKEGQLRR